MIRAAVVLALLTVPMVFAAAAKEEPVGLVMSAGGAKLLRANTETPLDARSGDLLFVGDGLRTEAGAASFLYCPAKSMDTLGPSGEIRFEAKAPHVKAGKITGQKPVQACFLPQVVRLAVASQQHYGVSMTRGLDKPDLPPTPRDKLPAAVLQELAPIDAALAADAKDTSALIAMAAVFEKNKLPVNALEQYEKVRALLPDAIWVRGKIFELQQAVADAAQAAAAAAPASGQTYALLVGVSKYKDKELSLQFADRDASVFDQLLQSPRGGGLPPDNVLLLTDEKATTAAVRNGFQDFLKRRATKGDTVIIMIAGHGTVEIPGSKKGFILTYDSDPQDLNSTALPMDELQSLFEEQLAKVGRVILFVDVCKSGTIGSIKSTAINSEVQHLGEVEGDLFGLMASRPRELSLEGPQFGGGHGVFSYFVLKGLEGAADANHDGKVDASELIQYVTDQVAGASENKQHPREFGTYDNSMKLSDVTKPGIDMARWRILYDSRMGEPLYLASASPDETPSTPTATRAVDEFRTALREGRLLTDQPDNAFVKLQALKPLLSPERYIEEENQLRVALEDRAQDVLLRYLTGDQIPQTRADFESAARCEEAARQLTPESLDLLGHQDFFQGRALLFDRQFPEAAKLLESAVRIDPNAGYAYNALGISYLEQAMFGKAIPAFRDAVRRAQHWSYPLHNLALAYVEAGNYSGAIRAYQDAMRLTPQYSYLPYNLGVVYQRIGKRKEAEAAYEKARSLAPNSPEPLNALGALKASEGKVADAERYYRTALQKDPAFLAGRQNLAVLLAGRPDRFEEATRLWQENLEQKPDYVPSRLSLAQALAGNGQDRKAIEQYRQIVQREPDYAAARIALADLLAKTGQPDEAIAQLHEALQRGRGNLEIWERLGDFNRAADHPSEARAAYESAMQFATDAGMRKRLRTKIASVPAATDRH
jgi:protein O-mannosyl-transferase